MDYRLAYNTTTGPLIVDNAGRMLGGGEWGPADASSSAVKSLVDAGELLWVEDLGDEPYSPELTSALEQLAERRGDDTPPAATGSSESSNDNGKAPTSRRRRGADTTKE